MISWRYSSVDLNKSSVYRYNEAPDFEILLLGYSVDDDPVQVVDLASGERIPEEILAALTDERVTKWAFNANFERVCLSRYLGMPNDEFLDPAQWRWWDVDEAVMTAVRDKTSTYANGIRFHVQSGMLFIHLPSGRDLCYAKPRLGENQFGSPAVTYMGVGATKKWERIKSYGPKFVENIVQGISRDLLCYAMRTLRCCDIVAHVHDEIILEADPRVSLDAVCEQMGRTPPWAKGLVLRADGYECAFYKKD